MKSTEAQSRSTHFTSGRVASAAFRVAPKLKTAATTLAIWLWAPAAVAPAAVGAQNDLRYVVFPETRRLVIDDRTVSVYDTGSDRISASRRPKAPIGR
jgi:hypothetical protein